MRQPARTDQTFFEDPAVDRLLGAVMTLAAELHVARDHTRVLEQLLVDKGVLAADDVHTYRPDSEHAKVWDSQRDTFITSLMQSLRGLTQARGD